MEKKIGIYKITSPKGKIYIGQSVDIERRWKEYKRLACKSHHRLYSSFIKYGILNHAFEIVSICNADELNTQEQYYQELFCCIGKNGLNCKITGIADRSGLLSDELKEKMSLKQKGRTFTDEHKLKLSIAAKKRPKRIMREDVKKRLSIIASNRSDETRAKYSLAMKNRKMSKESIEKACEKKRKTILDTQMGIFYFGCRDAAKAFGMNEYTLSNKLCGNIKNNTNLIYC